MTTDDHKERWEKMRSEFISFLKNLPDIDDDGFYEERISDAELRRNDDTYHPGS